MKIRQELLRFVSSGAPKEERLKHAGGEFQEEEGLTAGDAVTVLFILCHDKDQDVSGMAKKTLEGWPLYALLNALEARLDPLVIRHIVNTHRENEAVKIMAAINPSVDDETILWLAETGPEEVLSLLAEDSVRLIKTKGLVDAMKRNPVSTKSLMDSVEATVSVGASQVPKPIPQKEVAMEVKGVLKDEKGGAELEPNIYKMLQGMGIAQKIKFALTGNKSAREVLAKDSNKIIAMSVLKNPRITEDEVQRLASSKSTTDDILRYIGRNKEWTKNYSLKLSLVVNPKTPLTVSVKMLDHIYDKDLEKLAKSKNIPSVLASTARRKIEAKAKK